MIRELFWIDLVGRVIKVWTTHYDVVDTLLFVGGAEEGNRVVLFRENFL
jgi:hypothetical protein